MYIGDGATNHHRRYAWAWNAMLFAAGVCCLATLAAGFIPAWRAAIVGVRSLLAPGRE